MTTLRSPRLEQGMIGARWAGAVGAALALSLAPPPDVAPWIGWTLVVALAVGNVVIWQWGARKLTEREHRRLNLASFVFDIAMVLAFTLLLARIGTGAAWALVILLPVEGSFRHGMRGAIVGCAAALLIAAGFVVRASGMAGFDIAMFAFIAGLLIVVAGITGTIAEAWNSRRLDFELQATRLIEMDRLKDRYIAVTSHEIRGPLTAMMAAVDTIRNRWEKIPADRRDSLLEMVYLQGRALDRLVEDLMISAEVQAGRLIMHREWIELEPVIRRALDAAAGKRRAHLLEVFIDPIRCEIDPNRVSQIVRNLVENAYKYTPDRTRVAVTARSVQKGLHLEISDDGEGIPPEKRSQLFEAFSRIEETAAGREGVGLGLYVVSQLVAAMDGRIDLASSARGTTFSILIPCNRSPISEPHIGLVSEGDEQASG